MLHLTIQAIAYRRKDDSFFDIAYNTFVDFADFDRWRRGDIYTDFTIVTPDEQKLGFGPNRKLPPKQATSEGPSYQPEPRPSAGLWNDGPYMLYESKNTGLILLETEKRYYADLRAGGGTWSLTTFQNFPHMKANGFNPDWGQEQRRWWVAEMRKDGWKRFQPAPTGDYLREFKLTVNGTGTPGAIMDAAAAHVEDPSAKRDREAMKNRPPVVQTQKPVPTPVERPLCPVGMLNVTPINKWGRPQ